MEVNSGRFRQDLYFRLNVLTLNLPPLRDRGSDILLLADYFILKYCTQFGLSSKTISARVKNELLSYSWPGNIRELENIIQKAILLSEGNQIEPEYISLNKSSLLKKNVYETTLTLKEARSRAERETIVNALKKTRGNVSMSSKLLEIDRKWLMKKMDELDVSADDYRH
jgi:Nif-specific regulatory protein